MMDALGNRASISTGSLPTGPRHPKLAFVSEVGTLPRCPGAPRRTVTFPKWFTHDEQGLITARVSTVPTANLLGDVEPDADVRQESKARLERGLAIDELRNHLPKFFREPAPLDIYSENVVFVDNISPHLGLQSVTAVGKESYASLLWNMRFHASLFCSGVQVDILRFWQPSPDKVIVRWQIVLCPRVLNGVYGTKMNFDGTSEFNFNQEGKISRHSVDIVNTDGVKFNLNIHFLLHYNSRALVPTC